MSRNSPAGVIILISTLCAGCVTAPVYSGGWAEQVKVEGGACPDIDGEYQNAGEAFYDDANGYVAPHYVSLAHILNGGYSEHTHVAVDRLDQTAYLSRDDDYSTIRLELADDALRVTGSHRDGSSKAFSLPIQQQCRDSILHVESRWGLFIVMNSRLAYSFGRAVDGSLLVRTSASGAGLAFMVLPMAGSVSNWVRFPPALETQQTTGPALPREETRLEGR